MFKIYTHIFSFIFILNFHHENKSSFQSNGSYFAKKIQTARNYSKHNREQLRNKNVAFGSTFPPNSARKISSEKIQPKQNFVPNNLNIKTTESTLKPEKLFFDNDALYDFAKRTDFLNGLEEKSITETDIKWKLWFYVRFYKKNTGLTDKELKKITSKQSFIIKEIMKARQKL